MNYIIFDLEWNQGNIRDESEVKALPFEIIDIGAIQLNSDRKMVSEFNQLVKPTVYRQMHNITSKIIHLHMEDLMKGKPFRDVAEDFIEWCGDDLIFCTWGPLDLMELQRNMKYYRMPPLSDVPIRFLDVQKLFSIAYEDRKVRRSLEYAIDSLQMSKDIPFHRAFSDAYYTARIFQTFKDKVLENYSYDTFVLPRNRKEEIYVSFDIYHKYISAEFADKTEAINDREVLSTRCYLCEGIANGREGNPAMRKKNLKKKIRWFSCNGKHYYSVSICPIHGYMKAKIRIKKSEGEKVYIVKTLKYIPESELVSIESKRQHSREQRKYKKKV